MNHNEKPSIQTSRPWYKQPIILTIGVILLFIGISMAYFYPAAFEGRQLYQMDVAGASGNGSDVRALEKETGHRSFWTGSLFGGMPTYQISPSYPSTSLLYKLNHMYQLRSPIPILPGDTYLVFIMLIGFYIFMRCWGYRRLLSVAGAVMWAFSSYFIILIDAGHIWKLLALAYIPPTIGGLVLAFKHKKYLPAFFVTGIFTGLQIFSNHIQMSYYFGFVMLALIIGWAIEAHRNNRWPAFSKALITVVAAGIVGISMNATSLYHTYSYSKHTMRGGSELTVLKDKSGSVTNKKGLDKAYITQWSYGIDEMLTFLIPDARGGASGTIGAKAADVKGVSPQALQFVAQQNSYWGEQPFTAGPVYVGAFVLFLAILGLFICKGPMKWSILGVTILTIALSWGHHMMWLSDLFIDYFPMYNKFRTVSSILVVAEMTIPLFAIWALGLICKDPSILKREKRGLIIAAVITIGTSVLLMMIPSLAGSYVSGAEQQAYAPYMQHPQFVQMLAALQSARQSFLVADAGRSLIILLIGCGLLFLLYRKKINASTLIILTTVLVLVDLWSVDKRYLNDSKYLEASHVNKIASHMTPVDQEILKDTTQYRVMNLSVNTFNDATTSMHHRSVGGYHAAKLQRYQDLIDGYLSQMNTNVLRALNTKYYIVPDSIHGQKLITDEQAYGDAWFVDRIKTTKDTNEEFIALGNEPLNEVAILAPPFSDQLQSSQITSDSTAMIRLIHYTPDDISYKTSNPYDGLAVFSEIYYSDGWHATIDGKPAPILRANYLLRALEVPAGEHTIRFIFAPTSLMVTERIAYGGSLILFIALLVLGGRFGMHYRRKLHQV